MPQSVKIGGSLARNVRFDAPTCLVLSLWFSSGLAVSMGEVATPNLLHGVKASCNVVLRGRRGAFMTFSFCVAGASFSEDEAHFSWQAWHFGDLHCHFAWQAQHLRRVVLRVLCESHCQGCVKW